MLNFCHQPPDDLPPTVPPTSNLQPQYLTGFNLRSHSVSHTIGPWPARPDSNSAECHCCRHSLSHRRNSSGVGDMCCVPDEAPRCARVHTPSIVRSQSLNCLLRIAPAVQFLLPFEAHNYLLCPIHQPPRSQDLKIPRSNYTLY